MRIPARRVPPPLRLRSLRRTWTRLGEARARLAGGAVLGGATIVGAAVGAPQVAMISLMAYRVFARRPEERNANVDKTYVLAHRIAKHLLQRSGRSLTAVTAAETAVSIYMGVRAIRDNLLRRRMQPLLLPPASPVEKKEDP